MVFLHLLIRPNFGKSLKIWPFSVFARVDFREFVLAKSLTGINFRKITKILQNS